MRALQRFCGLLVLAAGSAQAQTMLDQEQRLIEIHSLLLALPPDNAPGAYQLGDVSLRLEIIGIPNIDGQTGGKRQFTASDKTFAFPRPRLAIGLPAPEGFRAFVGLSYVPPITLFDVNVHLGALEAGFAWAPGGPFTAGIRGQVLVARSKTSVTDPNTRDTLDNFEFGGDLSAGYRLDVGAGSVTPFAGVGLTHVAGDFRITSDNVLLTSRTTNVSFIGGLRLFLRPGIEAVTEVVVFPGVLVHPSFSLAWTFDWSPKH
ncbi:MAG TPA: autotransporter outer membrane beta-barrel domain-containing protein [Myxococcales bacterium]|jgi:hypothetical protein